MTYVTPNDKFKEIGEILLHFDVLILHDSYGIRSFTVKSMQIHHTFRGRMYACQLKNVQTDKQPRRKRDGISRAKSEERKKREEGTVIC